MKRNNQFNYISVFPKISGIKLKKLGKRDCNIKKKV